MQLAKKIILCLLVAGSLAMAVSMEIIYGTGSVYTHLFYFPIVLTSVWFLEWTLPVTFLLSVTHLLLRFVAVGGLDSSALIRTIVLLSIGSTLYVFNRIIRAQHKALDRDRKTYASTLMSIGDAVVVTDNEGRITSINGIAEKLIGQSLEKIRGKAFSDVFQFHPTDKGVPVPNPIREVLDTGRICYLPENVLLLHPDSGTFHVEDSASPIYDEEQNLTGVVMVFRDISEKIQKNLALARNQMLFQSVFDKAPIGIVLFDTETQSIVQANKAYCDMLGLQRSEIQKLKWPMITHAEDIESEMASISNLIHSEQSFVRFAKRYIHHDGNLVWANVTVTKLNTRHLDGPHHLAIIENITDQRQHLDRIDYLQNHDTLTGLFNRAHLEHLSNLFDATHHPRAVVFLDISGLKKINQTYGHLEGDRILKQVSAWIRELCRTRDYAFRVGADEFFIILFHAGLRQATRFVDHLRVLSEKHNDTSDADRIAPIHLTCGTAHDPDGSLRILELFNTAESTMYLNKLILESSGPHAVVHSLQAVLIEKSRETESHANRLGRMARRIGEMLSMSEADLSLLQVGAMLHDLGKIGIDEAILSKNTPLTSLEWDQIKRHPEVGCRIAQACDELKDVAPIILAHHEWYDGSGYPLGLSGDAIPVHARIIAVVDAFDAMTQPRPYGQVLTPLEAAEEIQRKGGTQFDPGIAKVFANLIHSSESTLLGKDTENIAG